MDDETEIRNPSSANVIGVKSWFAYVGVGALALLLFGVALPVAFGIGTIAAIVVFVGSALFVGYRIMMLRSVQLYYNDTGVWMYSGVLPWQKGASGVKWRDMDSAGFTQGFWSWSTRSYTVRIGHRFTKASEIVVTNIANGQDVVGKINGLHQEMLRSGRAG
ncbi:hypothetical protein [Massilia antarctica]|uniref:hypothetical protein n=1 Tax=Massilia antarctica TaxID=2765360 RepID=UPI0006BB7278|nr:hypothetical protein [Massilia sp. H27-R4]MCY0915853.1 hypothetical protein [Massilia sp. H27-R4]CUI06102.1 hypothetical protein BN2497_6981 [Janthinobacterium sp. CG23_2]CUU29888.1 hypothetical protein BN3177_6981 [Janthinobacterium sp. CG23_2]